MTPPCHHSRPVVHHTASTTTNHQTKEPPANTTFTSPHRSTIDVDTYASRLLREAQRIADRNPRRSAFDHDDIVSIVLEKFAKNCEQIMAKYAPEQYAWVAMGHAGVGFDRSERVGRAEGARLKRVKGEDGTPDYHVKQRTYVSGHTPTLDGDGELFDNARDDGAGPDVLTIEKVSAEREAAAYLSVLAPREREWLMLVDGHGFTVAQVADQYHLRRETVSRGVNAARKKVKARAAQQPRPGEDAS